MSYYLYIHESERGPYGEAELRDMLTHREVNGSVPARRADESEWSTLEACLAAQNTAVAAAAAPVSRPASPIPARFSGPVAEIPEREVARPVVPNIRNHGSSYSSHNESRSKVRERGGFSGDNEKHPGLGRIMYFLAGLGLAFFGAAVRFVLEDWVVILCCAVVFYLGHLALTYLRIKNIGWSWKWCLAPLALIVTPILAIVLVMVTRDTFLLPIFSAELFVAGMNVYLAVMCLAAPPGYARTKKFDLGGKIVLWLMLAFVILWIVAAAVLFIPHAAEIAERVRAARAARGRP